MNVVKRLHLFPFKSLHEFQWNKTIGHNGVISTICHYNRKEINCCKPKKDKEIRGDISRHTGYLNKVWKTESRWKNSPRLRAEGAVC